MEDTLVEVRSNAAKSIADQKDIERRLKKIEKAQDDWEAKAELAISKGRDDLAKGALIEKAKVADMAEHLTEELRLLSEALERNEEDVLKLEAKLREARAKKAALKAAPRVRNTVTPAPPQGPPSPKRRRRAEIMDAFRAARNARAGIAARSL